jgi:acetyl esterase/lipase
MPQPPYQPRRLIGLMLTSILAVLFGGALPAEAEEKKDPTKPAAATYEVKTVKDVVYYDGAGQDKVKHKLDLYLPSGLKDFPVMLFVHGGAWLHGDKDFGFGFYGSLAKVYAKQGVGVAVTNYRLSPGVKHPEHAKDVARAFAWLHKNAGKHGGDARKLFLCGHSAGGHLVALLTADESYLKEHKLTAKAIKGVIPISGVYTVPEKLFPQVFGTDKELRKKASPITHARKDLPPFLILYADKDFPGCGNVPSEKFCKALKDKGTTARTMEVKGSDHYRIIISAATSGSVVSNALLDFIRTRTRK